jgi:hybrid cluster-associated redox disulfide protein
MATAITKITKNTLIGDILNLSPEIEQVIGKHFGTACFTCPGVKMESIEFGAMMHNVDPQVIIDEINTVLEKQN